MTHRQPSRHHSRHARRRRIRRALGACSVSLGLALAVATLFAAFAPAAATAQDTADGFVIIVHADNPASSVESSRLQKMFLKKSKRWDDDVTVVSFDLDEDSEVRESFTRAIHGKSISAIKSYWQRMIFSGRDVPPDELTTDDEMIERVGAERGGLGYVSSDATLGDGVKAITVLD